MLVVAPCRSIEEATGAVTENPRPKSGLTAGYNAQQLRAMSHATPVYDPVDGL